MLSYQFTEIKSSQKAGFRELLCPFASVPQMRFLLNAYELLIDGDLLFRLNQAFRLYLDGDITVLFEQRLVILCDQCVDKHLIHMLDGNNFDLPGDTTGNILEIFRVFLWNNNFSDTAPVSGKNFFL